MKHSYNLPESLPCSKSPVFFCFVFFILKKLFKRANIASVLMTLQFRSLHWSSVWTQSERYPSQMWNGCFPWSHCHLPSFLMSPSLIKDPPLSDSSFLLQTSIHQCLTLFSRLIPPSHSTISLVYTQFPILASSFLSSFSAFPPSRPPAPILPPFLLSHWARPNPISSTLPLFPLVLSVLASSFLSYSILPLLPLTSLLHLWIANGRGGVGSGVGGKKSRLLLKNRRAFSCSL